MRTSPLTVLTLRSSRGDSGWAGAEVTGKSDVGVLSYDDHAHPHAVTGAEGGSYGYNAGSADNSNRYLYGIGVEFGSGSSLTDTSVPESAVVQPSDMIGFGDAFSTLRDQRAILIGLETLSRRLHYVPSWLPVNGARIIRERHAGRSTVAFCDGHVESIPFKDLLLDKDPEFLKRWHRDNNPHLELFQPPE